MSDVNNNSTIIDSGTAVFPQIVPAPTPPAPAATSVTAVSFNISATDRITAKTGVSVTLGFTTTAALATNGKITLNYPAGFFAAVNPANNAAGSTSVATMTATSVITSNSFVITTAVVGIAATTAFRITLSGLKMGAAALSSTNGITVTTDADTTASAGVASGAITAPSVIVSSAMTTSLASLFFTLCSLAVLLF